MFYNTKQRDAILNYISALDGTHVTAAQIIGHFKNESVPIGRTTVFRLLDRLTENGDIRRYTTDGVSGACYQFAGERDDCHSHLHLKCESCGDLIHLECDELNVLQKHMLAEHSFNLNAMKTLLYGECAACAKKSKEI